MKIKNMKLSKNLTISKGILYSLASVSIIGKITKWGFKKHSIAVAKDTDKSRENTVGYNDVNVLNNNQVHTNNFVILKVNKESDIVTLCKKLEFCLQNKISISLILDTAASDLVTMYEEIDLIQAIIKEYKIDLPIYCNINEIMNNSALNNSQRYEILSSFIEKMAKSDIYFGFYGNDSNLCNCNDYVIDISSYECFLVQENDKIKYDGIYNIKQDTKGNISSNVNLAKKIINNGFNNKNNLSCSVKYKVKKGDSYYSLALKYGLSEYDLRKYNDDLEGNLEVGKNIYIPSLYKTLESANDGIVYTEAISKGIDISSYQYDIDWNKVAKTSDFVIVEVARNKIAVQGDYITVAATQIKNVLKNKLDLGLYFCVSYEMDYKLYEKQLENYFTSLETDLKNIDVNLMMQDRGSIPVFLDFEDYCADNDYYKLMHVFEKVCKNHGFVKVGIYGNKYTLSSISSSLYKDGKHIELNDTNWYVWKAGGSNYVNEDDVRFGNYESYEIADIEVPKNIGDKQFHPAIIQVSNVCTDTGAANHLGNCDFNYCYSESLFQRKQKNEEFVENVFIDINKYKGVDFEVISEAISSLLIIAGVSVVAVSKIGNFLKFKIAKNDYLKDKVNKREIYQKIKKL